MVVYVDDTLMVAAKLPMKLWAELDKNATVKKAAMPICRYLGAHHRLEGLDSPSGRPRRLSISMRDYTTKAIEKLISEHGRKLRDVQTQYIQDVEWSVPDDAQGVFSITCSSHVAALLFLTWVCQPDVSVAVQRLCSAVAAWSTVHDQALIRLLNSILNLEVVGELTPVGAMDVRIADWNGDASTTKYTNGLFIELSSPSSGRCWPLAWRSTEQTCSSSSTCEAETISLSNGLRSEALPFQNIL
ncbi:unnamed protein product [Prorocentrum cordatum]|uniref:Reverse transcriptase domain-containing protein n=1 Tax=Prorocentrum cordatum TaxID=2364126 RepID=A0ABN9R1X5_9DINO|nr:unnamed protein product [Polarella glacialis]